MRVRNALALFFVTFFVSSLPVSAQSIDVTFRHIKQPGESFVRAYNPGDFNNWGNTNANRIAVGDASQMLYDPVLDEYLYTIALAVGATHQYKVHYHFNADGSSWQWISDPYNDRTDPANNDNSVVTIRDPMVFQPAAKLDLPGTSMVRVSAGIFGTEDVTAISFEINDEPMDGLPFFDASKRIFQYDLPSPVPAFSKFELIATDALGRTDSISVGIAPPNVVDEPLPAGVRDGITYDDSDPTSVTLSLFAPGKSFVHVIGDFSSWKVDDAYLMRRDSLRADSIRWWLTIHGLTPGQEYGFQYLVDNQIRMADPYATKLLDESSDGELGEVYPGLKPYPSGETSHLVGVLRTGQNAFAWTPYERPKQKDLVIYELLVRDFIAAHNYATLTDTLDYIERLGVNAIELMPISEFNRNDSWGYNPAFHLAVDKYYGPADDLKRFVDECHKRGIAVILDVVYNHATGRSPLIRLYNQSRTGELSDPPSASSIYANTTARHPFNVFNDLNHESTATKYWLDRANEYWLDEFNVDGFRFDLSKGFTQVNSGSNVALWSSYDASRIAILTRMADEIWSVDSTAYVILEHFADDREERELAEYGVSDGKPGMMLWNNKNFNYNEATMGYHSDGKSNFASVYHGSGGRGWTVPHLVSYMESHDEQWLMFKNLAFGACERSSSNHVLCDPDAPENFGTYNVRELNTALDRMKMAGAFFFTVPGPKMIWQFGELGYGYGLDGRECLRPGDGTLGDCAAGTPDRVDRKPIRWQYQSDPLRQRLYKAWSAIIHLRRNHEVFTSSDTAVDLIVSGAVKRIRLTHPSMNVAIIGNFDVRPRSVAIPFQHAGIWYDFFSGAQFDVVDPAQVLDLEPGEFHIYTDAAVETPEDGLITVGVEGETAKELPETVRFEIPYPNPFTREFTVSFGLPAPQRVRVELFDILGRRLKVLLSEPFPSGEHARSFEVFDLADGPYLLRFEAGGNVTTRTLVLVR